MLVSAFLGGVGCADDDGATSPSGTEAAGNDDAADGDAAHEDGSECVDVPKKADVLFVVDNSSSMGEEQGVLARSFEAFVATLDAADVDYRVAFTSTTNQHRSCLDTQGAGGEYELRSCLEREEQFTDRAKLMSRFNTGCQSVCTRTTAELGLRDAQWIEAGPSGTNVADGVSVAQALACVAPLGIDGCGFEAQLESAFDALSNGGAKGNAFVRDDAVLAVVFVTDESDCSINQDNPDAQHAFESVNEVFWAEAGVGPNSSICWNAGVTCEGDDGEQFSSCEALDWDAFGQPSEDPDAAVLYPVQRYLDRMTALVDARPVGGPEPILAMIAGFEADGSARYPSETGTRHVSHFGIGPGCQGVRQILEEKDPFGSGPVVEAHEAESFAVPPVRMLAVQDALDSASAKDRRFSICGDDYSEALRRVARDIVAAPRPCMPSR